MVERQRKRARCNRLVVIKGYGNRLAIQAVGRVLIRTFPGEQPRPGRPVRFRHIGLAGAQQVVPPAHLHVVHRRFHHQLQVIVAADVHGVDGVDGCFIRKQPRHVDVPGGDAPGQYLVAGDAFRSDLRRRDRLGHNHCAVDLVLIFFVSQFLGGQSAGRGIDVVDQPVLAHQNQPLHAEGSGGNHVRAQLHNLGRGDAAVRNLGGAHHAVGQYAAFGGDGLRLHPVCGDAAGFDLLRRHRASGQFVRVHRSGLDLCRRHAFRRQFFRGDAFRRQLVRRDAACRQRLRLHGPGGDFSRHHRTRRQLGGGNAARLQTARGNQPHQPSRVQAAVPAHRTIAHLAFARHAADAFRPEAPVQFQYLPGKGGGGHLAGNVRQGDASADFQRRIPPPGKPAFPIFQPGNFPQHGLRQPPGVTAPGHKQRVAAYPNQLLHRVRAAAQFHQAAFRRSVAGGGHGGHLQMTYRPEGGVSLPPGGVRRRADGVGRVLVFHRQKHQRTGAVHRRKGPHDLGHIAHHRPQGDFLPPARLSVHPQIFRRQIPLIGVTRLAHRRVPDFPQPAGIRKGIRKASRKFWQ